MIKLLSSLFSKKNILISLLILWMVFSIGYIGWSIWNNIKAGMLNRAYEQGVADVINQLISQTENNDCKPIAIFNKTDKKQVELVSATCISKPE